MGSLTSRPRITTGANTITQTQESSSAAPSETITTNGQIQEQIEAARLSIETEQRAASAASLLRRERGRFGTILTGFRGLLGANDTAQTTTRKTLLGE